ncbi:MAG: NAD(P)H-dependent oxidoreductase subunit E [Bacteroidota bacterium]|nr:NAD(P)H-dependent oxidoreductase subunit E [Bacteroidota bacterium]
MPERNDTNSHDFEPAITENRFKYLDRALVKHRFRGDALIEVLHTAQELFGYLSEDTMSYIAESLHLPLGKVYSVATFYPAFSLEPLPGEIWRLCTGTTCHLRGADLLFEFLTKGRVSHHGDREMEDITRTIKPSSCMGLCHAGPVGIAADERPILHAHENDFVKHGRNPREPEP